MGKQLLREFGGSQSSSAVRAVFGKEIPALPSDELSGLWTKGIHTTSPRLCSMLSTVLRAGERKSQVDPLPLRGKSSSPARLHYIV